MNKLTELLNTDFDGYCFKELQNNSYSMTDDENTITLKKITDRWQVWIDGSLCMDSDLSECIEWIRDLY